MRVTAFFVGVDDAAYRALQDDAFLMHASETLQGRDRAQRAVEPAAVRHGVDMRARPASGARRDVSRHAWRRNDQIAHTVGPHREAGLRTPPEIPVTGLRVYRRERGSAQPAR